MNIRGKTLSVMAASLVVSAAANYLILAESVWPSFVGLEMQDTVRNLDRAREIVKTEISDVSAGLWDYSSWDDTYAYALGNKPDFPETYLATDPLLNLGMDVIELYGEDNARLYQVVYDRRKEEMISVPWSMNSLDADRSLFAHENEESSKKGIMQTPRGPLLVASRPIIKTSGDGPIVGTFFFGRFLDEELAASLRDKIKVDFEILEMKEATDARDVAAIRHLHETSEDMFVDERSKKTFVAYTLLDDYSGAPLLLLKANIDRGITSIGRQVLLASAGGVILAGVVVLMVTALILQVVLVGPLVALTRHVVEIGTSGGLSRRIDSAREDEIGILSREFDKMLGNLKQARDQLLESSYHSGIAEMASGVLHNVRNQLMPLTMRMDRVREALSRVGTGKVDAALEELASDTLPSERRKKMLAYLCLCHRTAAEARRGVGKELNDVSQDLARLNDVLNELDRFSHVKMQLEPVDVGEVVTRTLSTIPTFPDASVVFEVDPDLQTMPAVHSAAFVLRQILNNLIVNAVESIAAAQRAEGHVKVSAETVEIGDRCFVDLRIADNGVGIAEENQNRVFASGYSTKNSASRGTGLHWSANAMAALQGRIRAESAGPGCGATFHVLLPIAAEASELAA